ncbi:hypothetical protein NicSoilC5_02460 [Arthrobacter sp. NicSoilC5]|nr:hypothetical protein [Arthrobacter sp. NicSoilC5]BCW78227.1 hypothetical protein NicSoilC5_02460 [Arthrobacter sp. NicSoilC5]
MNRFIWMGTGMLIAVIALRQVDAKKTGPGCVGWHRVVGRFTDAMHDFADAVRVGMHERDTELRGALRRNRDY